MATNGLLKRLVKRGDKIALELGRFEIKPLSGKLVDTQWLDSNRDLLANEISQAIGLSLFRFTDYSTGVNKGFSQDRLTLNFVDILTGQHVVQHYNVSVKYSRTTAKHCKDDALPKGRFIVGSRSKFVSFWQTTGLALPRKPSEYHGKIHLLKKLIFTGNAISLGKTCRFENKEIQLASVDHETIAKALNGCQQTANRLLRDCQEPANDGCQGNGANVDGERVSSKSNYASEKVRIKLLSIKSKGKPTNPVQDQSNEEWLAAYGDD